MGLSNRFRWYHPMESNSIVDLLNLSKFKSSIKTYFQNIKWRNKNFVQVFYLPIIIDNTFHIIYGIRTPFIYLLCFDYFFLSHQSLFRISSYWFTLILLFSIFFLAYSFFNACGRILPIFIFRIYIYNIYHCQEWISYYLDISILKSTILEIWKTKIGLRHTYERVYNNDVFGESNTTV